LLLYHAV